MGEAILPAPLGALAEVLQGEGLNGVEIAELVWLAGQLRREGGSPAVARRSKPLVGEPARSDEEDPATPKPRLDSAPEADSSQASGPQATPPPQRVPSAPTLPPQREPAADLQPRMSSASPRAESETDTLQVLVEDPPLISQPMRLARALAPLNRLVDAAGELELDEEATVEAIARAAVEKLPWQPMLRPRREPWLEISLVFDRSPSMAIWARLEKDLGRLFSRYLRLRDVRRFHLRHGPRGLTLTTPCGRALPPEALPRADRRQLVVLVSDGCAPAWFDGTLVRRFLGLWGETLPTVLLQVFPEWMWERTALGSQQALAATAAPAAAMLPASQALELRRLPLRRSGPALAPPPGTTVPVLELDADLLGAWARLQVGAPGGVALAYRFRPVAPAFALPEPAPAPEPAEESEPAAEVDLEHRLAIFLAHASPAAQRLLGLLSCAPLITLPIARLVQREMERGRQQGVRRELLPAAASAQLAEVLLSGLLVLVHEPEGPERSDDGDDLAFSAADTLVYGFATPELRERLLALVTLGQARQVVDRVESAVAASLGRSVEAFRALLCAPANAQLHPGAALLQTYARVSTRVLRRLGGRWADFAERVETAWEEAERRSRQPEEESLREKAEQGPLPCTEEEFHFSVARLQWVDALPPLPGQWKNSPQVRGFLEPLSPSLDLQLVEIPAGRFQMGSPPTEEGHSEDEGPQHDVTLESFFLGRTPITQAQWREVAGWLEGPGERWGLDLSGKLEPSLFRGDTRPVDNVDWFEAMEFCSRLSQRSGKIYTLPSEAQWEYACRADTTTPFHCGETLSDKLANYNARFTYGRGRRGQSRGETTEVGSFPANAWGLHDMHGNLWEWCWDHWHGSYDLGQRQAPGDGSPWLDAAEPGSEGEKGQRGDGRPRVLRGGSWVNYPVHCRSASRNNSRPANASAASASVCVACPEDVFLPPLSPRALSPGVVSSLGCWRRRRRDFFPQKPCPNPAVPNSRSSRPPWI